MRKFLVLIALLAVVVLGACAPPLKGTIVLKGYEPSHTYPMQGFRTYTRSVPDGQSCSYSTVGKVRTRSCYPKSKTIRYQQYDYWVVYQPECNRLTIEYEHEQGDYRMTTRCVPRGVWEWMNVGDYYDSEKNK